MTEQCSKEPLMVTIRCITYNHEPYIRQCLEGFVMQKTNFRFEAIVHDDASTDGTADIIREFADKYPGIIKPIFETENQYSKHDGSICRIMDAHTHGKYIAICEGDDYWIDPLKLQKQVDFMESHPEFGMCYTQCNYYYQNNDFLEKEAWGGPNESFKQFIMRNTVPTLTVMLRTEKEKEYIDTIKPSTKKWLMGDYPRWIWFSHESKIKFLNYSTGVYRVLAKSASHSTNINKQIEFSSNSIEIRHYFEHYFNVPAGTYVKVEALDKRKLYLYAVNHKYFDFFKIIYRHPKYLYNIKVIGYLRYFLIKQKNK